MSDILETALTPEQVVEILAKRGISISARSLRERARALGAYRKAGRVLLLMPEHIEMIIAEPQKIKLARLRKKSLASAPLPKAVKPAAPTKPDYAPIKFLNPAYRKPSSKG